MFAIFIQLIKQGIKVPDYILVERDEEGNVIGNFEEHEEYIVLDGIH